MLVQPNLLKQVLSIVSYAMKPSPVLHSHTSVLLHSLVKTE